VQRQACHGSPSLFGSATPRPKLQIFGVQPLSSGLAPHFTNSADQLVQLAIELGDTRDSLQKNATDAQRVSGDLGMLRQEPDSLSTALESSAAFRHRRPAIDAV
jgi:hypothetical protein